MADLDKIVFPDTDQGRQARISRELEITSNLTQVHLMKRGTMLHFKMNLANLQLWLQKQENQCLACLKPILKKVQQNL